MISRRQLLKTATGLSAGLALAGIGGPSARAASTRFGERILLLVELNGGNDGLNTVIPYADPAYRRLRRALAVPRHETLQLNDSLGLHPALEPLMPLWRDRQLAIALGVGYSPPNRSHFRSIEIWNTASDSEDVLQYGWVPRALTEAAGGLGPSMAADAVVLGGDSGPLAGPGLQTIVMRQPERFLRRAGAMGQSPAAGGNPALAHILKVRGEIHASAELMESRLRSAAPFDPDFPRSQIGQQLQIAARLIAADVPLGAIKVAAGGFDTHAGQKGRHARLLKELGEALAAFHKAMLAAGRWDQVLVMTYAEFGRRAAENASGGTDHGTAAPHVLLGGRVKGGLYGRQPSLTVLDGGDLRPGLDFRRLYATASRDWWGLPPTPDTLGKHAPLPCLA